jgi:hypothetical protein
MEAGTQEHEVRTGIEPDAELANLYGGFEGTGESYPMLVEPWEETGWDGTGWEGESELDAQIFVGLLRLAP